MTRTSTCEVCGQTFRDVVAMTYHRYCLGCEATTPEPPIGCYPEEVQRHKRGQLARYSKEDR